MDAYAPEAAVLSLDVLGKGQTILPCIFQQELAELLLRNRRFQIILAPLGVGAVEIGGAFPGVGLEADIRRCLHELGQVVAVRHGCFEVLDGALADGELIAVRQQTVQTFQHPQQDAGSLLGQLFDEEGIIHPGRVTVFHRDEDLSAPEAVAVIVSSHKVAIAEADETNVQQTLDSLLVFPLDAQTVLGGDDGLDVPCFGQSHHVQVVIDHDQLVLKVCTGKAVRFDAEDGFGVRGFPEQLLQQQADAGLPLAALAGHDQHLLRLGRRDQEIAKVFLQGQNILRDQQTVQKFQPLGRCGGIGLVFHGEPVQAEFLFRHKSPLVQKVSPILEMDAVKLGFPFGGIGFDTECVQNLLLLLGKVVEHKVTEVAVDFVEQCVLVHLAVLVKQLLFQAHHGVFL